MEVSVMAQNVTTAFVTLFDAEVKQAYQAESVLRGTTRMRTGIAGNTVKFPKIGKGVATPRVPQTDVTPLNVTYSQVTATMSDFIAAEYSDIFHQSQINFDERRELVEVVSKSIARRMMHASQLDALLGETETTSSDFATVKALVRGEIDTFMGFRFITIGDRDEGGVPKPSTRTCFAWHMDACGYAESMAQKTEVNYIPEKTSFLVSSMFSAGAVAIDDEGIVKISCTEA